MRIEPIKNPLKTKNNSTPSMTGNGGEICGFTRIPCPITTMIIAIAR
jgi:hypothetical protein